MVSTSAPSHCTASIRQPRTISPFDAHRAGAAHAVLAADMAAGEREILAQEIDQCLARLDAGADPLAVYVKRDLKVARAHSCPERLSPRYG